MPILTTGSCSSFRLFYSTSTVTEGTITGYIYLNMCEYHSILQVTNVSIIIQQC